jgi:hypothetical protein
VIAEDKPPIPEPIATSPASRSQFAGRFRIMF